MSATLSKVFIVGCSGSGKTTVARRLSTHLGLELHELDFIAWDRGGDGSLLPYEQRVGLAHRLSRGESWVVEGTYLGWTTPFMDSADVIVWMDVPLRTALWRVFWRHVRAEMRRDNSFPGWIRLFSFLKMVTAQYRDRFDLYEPPDIPIGPENLRKELAAYTGKVVIGSGASVVDEVIRVLGEAGSQGAGQ